MRYDPLVSAVIPTYNRQYSVCEAVDSVLRQTYERIEVIVVDDGSTDDTLRILHKYGDRIRVIAQGNSGPSGARNRGIAVSRGEIIAFLDSDDLWLPTKIERQVRVLRMADKSIPCCLCNIKMQWFDKVGASFEVAALEPAMEEGIWLNPDEVLSTRFVLFNQGVAVRHEVLDRTGGFDESLRLLEDYELSLRISLEGPWSFIREPLVIWRQSSAGSLSQDAQRNEMNWRRSFLEILEKHLTRVQHEQRDVILVGQLDREVRRARRLLRAAKLSEASSWSGSALGRLLQTCERSRGGLFRRSPWFPQMKIERLGS